MKFLIILLLVVTGLALPARAQLRLCEQTYGNSASTNFYSYLRFIDQAGNGIIASGNKRDKTTNQYRRCLFRLGLNCDTVWTRTPSANFNLPGEALTAFDGNYLFSGLEETAGIVEHFLEKFSPAGSLLWRKKYLLAQNAGMGAFVQLPDSGFFLLGFDNAFQQQFFLFRTDKLGNQAGINTHNVPLSATADPRNLWQTKEKNIIVTGTSYQTGWIYKLNSNGDSLKYTEVNISNRNDAIGSNGGIIATADSGIVVVVTSIPVISTSNPDSISYQNIVKLDKNLNIKWRYKQPVTPGYYQVYSGITELADGSVVLLSSGVGVNTTANYQLVRISKTGQLLQTFPFTSTLCNRVSLSEGVYMGDSTVYVVGYCYPTSANSIVDAYVARLTIGQTVTGVKEAPVREQVKVYPNPATSTVTFALPESSREAKLELFNNNGQKVKQQQLQSQQEVSLAGLSPGLYFYRVQAGRNVYTGKLIKE
jgi:hypothetical protein